MRGGHLDKLPVERTLRLRRTLHFVGERLVLAIDVCNTNVKVGTFKGAELSANFRLETDPRRMPDEYAAILDWLLHRRGMDFKDIAGVSLSSTVPAMVPVIRELVRNYIDPECPLVEVNAFGNTGVQIDIENPREMGPDRIVDALAAKELYRLPAIIVDFGTSPTFAPIDRKGRLLGTSLAPGLRTAMDGLFQLAALLSRIELE